jgi:hypothetical protein
VPLLVAGLILTAVVTLQNIGNTDSEDVIGNGAALSGLNTSPGVDVYP